MIAGLRLLALIAGLTMVEVDMAHAAEPKPFVAGSWASIRAAHAGKPLIVHFWGLTCAPCRTEMPEWGRLMAEMPSSPLIVVHAERPPSKPDTMTQFIASSGLAATDTWYFADRFLEPLRFEIDPGWHGEMPMTLLIAKGGTVRTIIGTADLAEVRQWLDSEAQK